MKLIYLQEETPYKATELVQEMYDQLKSDPMQEEGNLVPSAFSEGAGGNLDSSFLDRLKKAMDGIPKEDCETVVVRKKSDKTGTYFTFKFIGLFDFIDDVSGRNLTFFFFPKFVKGKLGTGQESTRNTVLLAVDRYNRELNRFGEQAEETKRHEGLLELAVRVLRDYLENGVYTRQQRELEHNGQGEIDWETTIDQYQSVFLMGQDSRKRPVYVDTATELANPDEDHYITRLHQCLVTTWGRKLEELGLSSVLRVNVPLLSEDELVHFGTKEYQLDQIRKEMGVQFVTKSRHTLSLMKELIERMSESQSANNLSLSFGMNGAEHLWEKACAEVLGSELGANITDCGLHWGRGGTFWEYMPKPMWRRIGAQNSEVSEGDEKNAEESSIKSGWKLDFIRTYHSADKKTIDKLVILDAKYYSIKWSDDGKTISKQPSIGDIAKQIFYQMAFKNLVDGKKIGFVNAFLFPKDDNSQEYPLVSELVRLGWSADEIAIDFKDVPIFGVRLPGIKLLKLYANGDTSDDWFGKIVDECGKFNPQPRT